MIAALDRRPTRPHDCRRRGDHRTQPGRGRGLKLLVFDSGIGGLSVAREIRTCVARRRRSIYVADDAGFPYGDWEESALTDHVVTLVGDLIGADCAGRRGHRLQHGLDAGAAAAARAPFHADRRHGAGDQAGRGADAFRPISVLGHLRHHAAGLHPRADPAVRRALPCAPGRLGQSGAAGGGLHARRGGRATPPSGRRSSRPSSSARARAPTSIVLACTHYPFLIDRFERLAPWPVDWIDPAPAIARRVAVVAGPNAGDGQGGGRAWLTSARRWPRRSLVHCSAPLAWSRPRAIRRRPSDGFDTGGRRHSYDPCRPGLASAPDAGFSCDPREKGTLSPFSLSAARKGRQRRAPNPAP